MIEDKIQNREYLDVYFAMSTTQIYTFKSN